MVSAKKILYLAKLLIGWPLGIIAIGFILKFLIGNSSLVLPKIKEARIEILILSFVCFFIYYCLRVFGWKLMIELKGHRMSLKSTAYAWQFSEIKRYVPGNVWSFLSRAKLFEDLGIPKKVSGKAILIEIEFLIISNAILSLLALTIILSYLKLDYGFAQSIFVILIFVVTFALLFGSILNSKLQKLLPDYGLGNNLKLLLIYLTGFFFFASGIYFAASSVLGLKLENFLPLIGFFSFSFLVGYLSLITPSGIGVREAVVTYGLASLFSVPIAGLIAIFSRIILVTSELIFTVAVFIWSKTKPWNS